jgi:hypothetical protein
MSRALIIIGVCLLLLACGGVDGYSKKEWRKVQTGIAQSLDQVEFSEWMGDVKDIARRKDEGIDGDEKYFLEYYRKGYTPAEAIRHWEKDPWPNNGGGE